MSTKHSILYLSQKEFDDLGEYSCSIPTGVIIGKRWKRNCNAYRKHVIPFLCYAPDWLVGEYIERLSETEVLIRWYDPVIGEPPPMPIEIPSPPTDRLAGIHSLADLYKP